MCLLTEALCEPGLKVDGRQRIIDEEIRAQRLELISKKARIDSERESLTALVKVKDRQLSVASQRARE